MKLGRRQFVFAAFGTLLLPTSLVACSSGDDPSPDGPPRAPDFRPLAVAEDVFAHGVASGDPLADRVILWTRVTTAASEAKVRWVVARDPELADVARHGVAETAAARDFTIKVDVTGLEPATTYYYAFALADGGRSITGRTRTLPQDGADAARFAFVSCSNYNNGYFNAYRAIARRHDLDFWVHLGDYIYEYADGAYGDESLGRTLDPRNETVTLEDYRRRYALYRTDRDLKELHRQLPCIVVWDDHESANDAYRDGAQNHVPSQGDWEARKRAAAQAYLEWLPIRAEGPGVPVIYRSFRFGSLFDLAMLDTRLIGRDVQAGAAIKGQAGNKGTPAEWTDPNRQLLGAEQEQWLKESLSSSKQRGAAWRFLGNQVMFSPVRDPQDGQILFPDMWDGYQAARTRIASHLVQNGIDNLVILTGDIHTSWALDVPVDPFTPEGYDPATGRGAYAVELVTPAVTSLGLEGNDLADAAPELLRNSNPHLKFAQLTRKGYVLVDVTRERVQGEWYFVRDHKVVTDEEELAATFTCASGTPRLVAASAPSPSRAPRAPAPSA
jgi:alkaline phosphatase D